MKQVLILLLVSISLSAQNVVRAIPQRHSMVNIHGVTTADTVQGAAFNTTAIDPSQWNGTVTLFFIMDTTDSGTPGTAGLKPQLYNSLTSTWFDYHDLGDMLTIPAANWANKSFYVDTAIYDDHAWADSMRWVFTPQSADTGLVRIDMGGQ